MLFDLPPVAARGEVRLRCAKLDAAVHGGDLRRDPLPEGADVISLVRVIHDHGDADALAILRRVRRVLPPDGVLLLAEPMAGMPGAEAVGAYFAFYLLALGSGRPRRPADLTSMLREAGFTRVRRVRTGNPVIAGLLTACS